MRLWTLQLAQEQIKTFGMDFGTQFGNVVVEFYIVRGQVGHAQL